MPKDSEVGMVYTPPLGYQDVKKWQMKLTATFVQRRPPTSTVLCRAYEAV
jgi:hypothetical protein